MLRKKKWTMFPVLVIVSLLLAGASFAGTLQDVKARGKILAGVKTDFPPFGFVDEKGVNKGFDVDIAKALAKALYSALGGLCLTDLERAHPDLFVCHIGALVVHAHGFLAPFLTAEVRRGRIDSCFHRTVAGII